MSVKIEMAADSNSNRDIDVDDDGLIEICYLEDLNAIRYQLDGSGYKISAEATKITNGCDEDGAAVCIGYELMRDLDFATTQSYINVATNRAAWTVDNFNNANDFGWAPIGTFDSNDRCGTGDRDCFSSIFEGNGNRISNLQINRRGISYIYIGLFAGNSGSIRNIRLSSLHVDGNWYVGGLVGANQGIIMNSDVAGTVIAQSQIAGGLVAFNLTDAIIINSYASGNVSSNFNSGGGLVAINRGHIINSYAAVDITNVDPRGVSGGLTARMSGSIVNSYATGAIMSNNKGTSGGLLGIANNVQVINSYSIGTVSGPFRGTIGGFIGKRESGASITDSYWNRETSKRGKSAGGDRKTTAKLQLPTMATGIYANWSANDWDFGNTMSYPALRYNEVDDVDACDSDPDTALPRCGTLLPGQSGRDSGLNALFFKVGDVELNAAEVFGNQPFSSLIFDYNITIPAATFQIEPHAINDVAISIMKDGDNTNYFADESSDGTSEDIMLATDDTDNIVKVIVADTPPRTYTFTISTEVPISITNASGSEVDKVNEGEKITLTAGFRDIRNYRYSWQQDGGIATEASSTPTLTLRIPGDFIGDSDTTMQRIEFTLNANDGSSTFITNKILPIIKVPNGAPSFIPTVTTSTISIAVEDPDGEGMATYVWEQRGIDDASWEVISGATMKTYRVSSQATGDTFYRVRVSDYVDRQGYPTDGEFISDPYRLRSNIDDDSDGLIDIYYLEDLDKVRHQLDGSGYKESSTADEITVGCPTEGCNGYELRRDLDFATTQSYINAETNKAAWTVDNFRIDNGTDVGWDPIESHSGILEGNGNRIFNLQINRGITGTIGLFAENSGLIRNIGLSEPRIEGGQNVGSLVGVNRDTIINSDVDGGSVLAGDNAGGLVGFNEENGIIINSHARGDVSVEASGRSSGGLSGVSGGRIINSYATGTISGSQRVGGLVGVLDNDRVVNSYATGEIPAGNSSNQIGGLLGAISSHGVQVINSYSIVRVNRRGGTVGGLIGNEYKQQSGDNVSIVENSYWDRETSNQTSSAGGTGQDHRSAAIPDDGRRYLCKMEFCRLGFRHDAKLSCAAPH